MCGIAAIVTLSGNEKSHLDAIERCGTLLKHRGPDNQQFIKDQVFAMAHARLSIIDLSSASDQPFTTDNGEITAVYNGEIFNYKDIRKELMALNHTFHTEGDVEVLVRSYLQWGPAALHKINGFFSFALFNKRTKTFFAARDRFGVKPFYYYYDKNYFACASELRPLQSITGSNEVDKATLFNYFQLSYVPEKACMLKGIKKLEPGHCISITNGEIKIERYYKLSLPSDYQTPTRPGHRFRELLEDAVRLRLVSDVPVATFLSGGIDSGVVTALAAQMHPGLQTFSIGFKGNAHFDESPYAEELARQYNTHHHTFHLTEEEAEGEIEHFFNSIDEPFADSSAFNVFILCKKTKEHVKVVLSGDGADEVLAGYNKHSAEWMIRHKKAKTLLLKQAGMLSALVPASRNNRLSNAARQLARFAAGAKLKGGQRYWRWASFYEAGDAIRLLKLSEKEIAEAEEIKEKYTSTLSNDLNSVLLADMHLVLASDMLVKVDRMSMANGLEVRDPFLDHRLVEFAFSLAPEYKIGAHTRKKILKESCGDLLPAGTLSRKKHGFETPVQFWLRTVLRTKINELLLNEKWIKEQGIFNYTELRAVCMKALSNNPGDTVSAVWSALVFNHWYKKNLL